MTDQELYDYYYGQDGMYEGEEDEMMQGAEGMNAGMYQDEAWFDNDIEDRLWAQQDGQMAMMGQQDDQMAMMGQQDQMDRMAMEQMDGVDQY